MNSQSAQNMLFILSIFPIFQNGEIDFVNLFEFIFILLVLGGHSIDYFVDIFGRNVTKLIDLYRSIKRERIKDDKELKDLILKLHLEIQAQNKVIQGISEKNIERKKEVKSSKRNEKVEKCSREKRRKPNKNPLRCNIKK